MAYATLLLAAVLAMPRALLACEAAPSAASPFEGLCAVVSGPCARGPHIAVLSAFIAEQRMLRAAAEITSVSTSTDGPSWSDASGASRFF